MSASSLGDDYSRTGAAWQRGPGVLYDRLAEELVGCAPDPLTGRLALDVGAGTGAATRALVARGARVVALDAAIGMLRAIEPRATAAVVGDATALALRSRSFDAVVAAFSWNHLPDPVVGVREAARVTRGGGIVLGSAYAHDDDHVAKRVTEAAAGRAGWRAPDWYAAVRADAMPKLATADRAAGVIEAAGCAVVLAEERRVSFAHLDAAQLVAWRLGMAQLAPFMAALDADRRAAVVAEVVAGLRDAPPLVRSVVVFAARVPDQPAGARRTAGASSTVSRSMAR